MKKKKLLLCLATTVLSIGLVGTIVTVNRPNVFDISHAENSTYTISVGSAAFSTLDTNFKSSNSLTVGSETSGSHQVNLLVKCGKKSGSSLALAQMGKICNSGDSIHGIKSIKVSFTGSLFLQLASTKDGKEINNASVELVSGETVSVNEKANNFCLTAGTGGAVISNIEIKYSCEGNESFSIEDFDGAVFNGTSSDCRDVILQINGNTVTAKPQNFGNLATCSGTAEIVDNNLVLTLNVAGGNANVVYTFAPSSDLANLTFVSLSGAYASAMPELSLSRMYIVDNFENYSETGVGVRNNISYDQRSGLQGAYYADYQGTNTYTTLISSSNFSKMDQDNTDYLTLDTENVHSGSKAAKYQVVGGKWTRFWSFDKVVGMPYAIGKGAYLSAWVKNPTSNDIAVKFGAINHSNALTDSNRSNGKIVDFTISKNSGWIELMVPLTSTDTYYGWYLGFNSTNSSTSTLYVDDVAIYTQLPYASENFVNDNFAGNLTKTYSGTVSTVIGDGNIFFAVGKTNETKCYFYGQKATVTGMSIDGSGNITINTDCSFEKMSNTIEVTAIKGKMNPDGSITNVSLEGNGTLSAILTGNGTYTLSEVATKYSFEDMSLTEVGNLFKLQDMPSSEWTTVSPAGRVGINETTAIEGNKSLRVTINKKSRVVMKNDFAKATTIGGIGVWLKNAGSTSVKARIYFYKAAGLNSGSQGNEVTLAPDGQWHYVQCGNADSVYNFGVYFESRTPGYIYFDYFHVQ